MIAGSSHNPLEVALLQCATRIIDTAALSSVRMSTTTTRRGIIDTAVSFSVRVSTTTSRRPPPANSLLLPPIPLLPLHSRPLTPPPTHATSPHFRPTRLPNRPQSLSPTPYLLGWQQLVQLIHVHLKHLAEGGMGMWDGENRGERVAQGNK
ncbi:unnamed protein product [Closterium sp. NIES-64]|nr:unnamed protein product [Closterium sp. NIES-64]